MPTSQNRTKWPVGGGAISLQPGWFQGHATAFIYINLGLGSTPPNMSHPMVPPFQIVGPSNDPYPGTICLPQVLLPTGVSPKVGDLATIQVIETAKHGAALYNVFSLFFFSLFATSSHDKANLQNVNSAPTSNSPNQKTSQKSPATIASTPAPSPSKASSHPPR